ncbi:MAG: hypothetical protein ACT4QE_21080 [Anaerolineales bacterium]
MHHDTYAAKFVGRWIGHTQGVVSPAHVWEITQAGRGRLHIVTRWEEGREIARFQAELASNEAAFELKLPKRLVQATLVDSQHFIIPEWDTNDIRADAGPDYDVVFSRPGLAELTARGVWLRHREGLKRPVTVT